MNRMFTVLPALALALVFHVDPAEATLFRVAQESAPNVGDFDANVLGFVTPYVSGLTASGFYRYGNPNGASYNGDLNGGPAPVSSLTQIFLLDALDGLSVVMVHDRPNDGSGGNMRSAFGLLGDTASILVKDDPANVYTENGTDFTAVHPWGPCCTDGWAIGSLDGNWELLGELTRITSGITAWQVTSADGNDLALVFTEGRRVQLKPAATAPEPATLALLGFALAGLGLVRRRA